jgi:hypothetical protein
VGKGGASVRLAGSAHFGAWLKKYQGNRDCLHYTGMHLDPESEENGQKDQ